MRSIRAKTTLLTVLAVIVSMTVATALGTAAIRDIGHRSSEQLLTLMCQTGESNLNAYFDGVERSVGIVSSYVEEDLSHLDSLDERPLAEHVSRVSAFFGRMAFQTNGVLTYYYRRTPSSPAT